MKAIIEGKEYLDVKAAAQIAGYTEEHVRRLVRAGDVTGIRRGTMVFVDEASLRQYVADVRAR